MKGAISMFQFENKKVFYFGYKLFVIQYYVLYKLI